VCKAVFVIFLTKISTKKSPAFAGERFYSTVTDFARLRGWSGFNPFPVDV